ncbi:hypothetical protein FRB90_004556 [Tulasnella sp. 427]|nr:hypothetical protein FRB90_004556 [Tulasnella sp. 427]
MAAAKRKRDDEPEAANAQAKKALKAKQAKGGGSSKSKKPAPPPLPSDSPVKTRQRKPSARALEVIEAGRRQAEGRQASPQKRSQAAKPKPTEMFTFHEQQPPAPKIRKTTRTTNAPTSAPVRNPASIHSKTAEILPITTSVVPVNPPPCSGIGSATPAPSRSTFAPRSAQKIPMDLTARIYPPAKPMRSQTRRSPSPGKEVNDDDEDDEVDEDHREDDNGNGNEDNKGGEDDEDSGNDEDSENDEDEEDNEDEAGNNYDDNYCIDYDNDDFAHGKHSNTFDETEDWDDIDGGTLQETGQRDEDEEEHAVRRPGQNTTTGSTRFNRRAGEGDDNGNNGNDRDNHGNKNSAQPTQPMRQRSNNTSESEAEDRPSDDDETEEIPLDMQQEPRRRKRRSQRQTDGEDSSHGDRQDSNKGSANRTLRAVAPERREVVKLAFVRLRCFTATRKPFPSPEEESQMIDMAWKWVQDNYKEYASLRLLSHERPVMQVYISNIRGKIKTAARTHVKLSYPWSKQKRKNIDLYNRLMENDAYTAKDPNTGEGRWCNSLLFSIVQDVFFCTKQADGWKQKKLFRPASVKLIALVYTAIHCALDEWEKGFFFGLQFTAEAYQEIYRRHLENLYSLKNWDSSALDVLCRMVYEDASGKTLSDKGRPPPARHTEDDHEKTVRDLLNISHRRAME